MKYLGAGARIQRGRRGGGGGGQIKVMIANE